MRENKTPGILAPRVRRGQGEHEGARPGAHDPLALTPAPARTEKFARPHAPQARGRPAPSSTVREARAQRGACERAPLPRGRERRPLGPRRPPRSRPAPPLSPRPPPTKV